MNNYSPDSPPSDIDALLLVSFGGPEGPDDVMPFLENVVCGKNVPRWRLMEVARHYELFGGVSPSNSQNRALLASLVAELNEHGPRLPVYWGNRHWHPMLADTIRQMADDGVRHALALVTSAFGSSSGCQQYVNAIQRARAEVGPTAPRIDKLRLFFNHPGFIEALADRVAAALAELPDDQREKARLLFSAHSLPVATAERSPYVRQLREACRLAADLLMGKEERGEKREEGEARSDVSSEKAIDLPSSRPTACDKWKELSRGRTSRLKWELVFQSRSGPPSQPWLEPDIRDHIRMLHDEGGAMPLVVVPIGFLAENMEVVYDLDVEVRELCDELGVKMVRTPVVGNHLRFVRMIRELIVERLDLAAPRLALGTLGPWPDECPADCCIGP